MLSLKRDDAAAENTALHGVYEQCGIDPDTADAPERLERYVAALQCDAARHAREQAQAARDLERLNGYVSQLIHDLRAIQHSRAWKIGYRLTSLLKALLGRARGGDGFSHIERVIEQYEHWKKSRD